MTKANDYQVDGSHYQQEGIIQHWDYAASQQFDYFQGQITKYITRWKKKNGLKDLEKARHFIEKYIEVSMIKTMVDDAKKMSSFPPRVLPPRIDATGQDHPFGFDYKKEQGTHPLANAIEILGKDI